MDQVRLYWHTLRYLRPIQVYGRLRLLLPSRRLDTSPPPARRAAPHQWLPPAPKPQRMIGPSSFQFLGEVAALRNAASWEDPARSNLWLYNLHYFDDLSAVNAATRSAWHSELVSRWIAENRNHEGIGWEPYPTSLRIVNWIKWVSAGNVRPHGFDHSLALQTRWLASHVEHHLLGNHLLANAKALVVSGLYFEGAEADRWREMGLALLVRELNEQIHADGGHFELSPMYHALILEDVLDLVNAAQAARGVIDERIVSGWAGLSSRMHGWLLALSHPDGNIAFFNDAAFGVASTPRALTMYASRLGLDMPQEAASPWASGYRRVECSAAVLLVDLAKVGVHYQPGHAHADTLSFELSLHGRRVFVNSGTSTYQPGPQREFERSTAAHNTVEVDGKDSSEVWSAFRVARRARPHDVAVEYDRRGGFKVRGSHDGYARLGGKVIHSREWIIRERDLIITDRLTGRFDRAIARFYLHPSVVPQDGAAFLLPNGETCRWSVSGGEARLVETRWHPEFGRSDKNWCLEIVLEGNETALSVTW